MKRMLLLPALIVLAVLFAGCQSKEEQRDSLMENAKKLEASADCAKAREEARKALEIDPNCAAAYLLLGRCDMKEEKWADALHNFGRAHSLAPTDFDALRNLSRLSLMTEDVAKAEEYASKALALRPDSVEVKVTKANLLMRKKDILPATQLLEEAVKLEPANEEAVVGLASAYLNTNKAEHAKALLKYALEKKPDSSAMLTLLLNLAFREQDYASAQQYLTKLQTLHPDDEHLVIQMADLLSLLNKGKDAPAYLADYLTKYPKADTVRMRMAELSLTDGKVDAALAELDKAPEATPALRLAKATILVRSGRTNEGIAALRSLSTDAKAGESANTALLGLAEVYLDQEQPDAAIKALTDLIARSPDNLNAYILRGQTYYFQKRYAEAVADLSVVVKGAPDNYSAALSLADAQNAAGDHAQAEKIIRDVIKRTPDSVPAYIALANFFMVNTNPYEALAAIREGRKALPNDPELAIAETDILIREKRYTEATDLLDVLAKNDKTKGAAFLRLATVYASGKDYAKAIKAYDQLLALDPNATAAVDGRIRMHLAAGEPDKALAFAEKRQKDRPADPMAALMVGETSLVNKNAQKAEKAFLRALELAPQWEQPASRLAQLYAATKRVDDGITAVKALLSKTPDGIAQAVLLANLYEQKADWKNAEQAYRDILKQQSDNILASNNLAYLLSQHSPTPDRLKEAEEFAAKAAATNNATILDTLGWIQHLRDKKTEAEATLRKARAEAKENPVIAYHLAVALAAQSDAAKKNEAKALLKEIIAGKTSFPQRDDAEKLLKGL